MTRPKKLTRPHCPDCGLEMSDWFVWDGLSYCYPCKRTTGKIITEKDAVMKIPDRNPRRLKRVPPWRCNA